MKTLKLTLILMLAVLGVVGIYSCGHRSGSHADAIGRAVDSLFSCTFTDEEPGAVVLVSRGDSIIFSGGYGMADMAEGKPLTDTTMISICSISKQFTAMALLKLQEQGLININDSLPKFFKGIDPEVFNKVTLRHLLSHTSGIPDNRPHTPEEWQEYMQAHDSHFGTVRDFMLYSLMYENQTYLDRLDTLVFNPGSNFDYENLNYQLMVPILEEVAGENFNTWMRENIFEPAGMKHTEYFKPSHTDRYAHAYKLADGANIYKYYRSEDGKWEEYDYGEANFFPSKADSGIYTTAIDFFNWQRALFGGKIVGEESLKMAITPQTPTHAPNTFYGLGLFIERVPGRAEKVYHIGSNAGYRNAEAYFPEKGVSYLIFANRAEWDRSHVCHALDSILAANGWI